MRKFFNQSLKFLSFFLIFFAIFNFRVSFISGNSMLPTLKNNSMIIVDQYLFKLFTIKNEDILIFRVENEEVIKRIHGLPGETIETNERQLTLKKDEIYVLGDNPKESIDSRMYGPLKINNIVGKIFLSF